MRSPFKFGKIVTGEYFVNREKEIKRLQSNFNSGNNTILLSPRRLGKSSLVEEAANKTRNKKTKFVFINFYNIRSEEEFYNIYLREILKATLSKTGEFLKAGKEFFKKIIPQLSYKIDPQTDLTLKLDWEEVVKAKEEVINLPEVIANKKNINISICIDEFQSIAKLENYIHLEEDLRACWQNHQKTSYCLYGSKLHMMLDIFNKESRPFYRFGDMILLDKISKEHWVTYITKSFSKTGKVISKEFAEIIAYISKNHPYYVQQLSHHVWNQTETEVTEEILHQAVDMVISTNAFFYQESCDNLSSTQINLLIAVIEGETKFTSAKVMANYKLGTPRNVSKNKRALEVKDIIDFNAGKTYFLDPFLEYWFEKTFKK